MIWSLYAMLGTNMWYHENDRVLFDDEAWDRIVTAAADGAVAAHFAEEYIASL